MDFVNGTPRDQTFITPLVLLVESESFVRVIDAFVDAIDFDSFEFKNATLQYWIRGTAGNHILV